MTLPNLNPCWILTYPRTGSSYLCTLLNATGLFAPPMWEEQFNPFHWDQKFLKHPPRYNKVHNWAIDPIKKWDAYRDGLIKYEFKGEKRSMYFKRGYLEEHLPGIKYVLLRRKDFVSVAVSSYLAKKTGVWRVLGKEKGKFEHLTKKKIPYNFRKIRHEYNVTRAYDRFWMNYVKRRKINYIKFPYCLLVRDAERVVREILEFIGYKGDVKVKTTGPEICTVQEYDVKNEYKARFRRDLKSKGLI